MAKIKLTGQLRSPDELLAEGTSKGDPCSSFRSHRLSVQIKSTSTSSPSEGKTSGSGRAVLKKRGRAREDQAQEVIVEGTVFPGAPVRSDIEDGRAPTSPTQGHGLPEEVGARRKVSLACRV